MVIWLVTSIFILFFYIFKTKSEQISFTSQKQYWNLKSIAPHRPPKQERTPRWHFPGVSPAVRVRFGVKTRQKTARFVAIRHSTAATSTELEEVQLSSAEDPRDCCMIKHTFYHLALFLFLLLPLWPRAGTRPGGTPAGCNRKWENQQLFFFRCVNSDTWLSPLDRNDLLCPVSGERVQIPDPAHAGSKTVFY